MDIASLKQNIHGCTEEVNWWEDGELMAELDDREAESLKDDVKTFSLDEAVEMARQSIKKNELQTGNWWRNKHAVTEIERRTEELRTGKEKGVTWNEVKERIRKSPKI